MSSVKQFLSRRLVQLNLLSVLVILIITLKYALSVDNIPIFINAFIRVATGVFGIVLGFEINRHVTGNRNDREAKRLFEHFISELLVNSELLSAHYKERMVTPPMFQRTIWEALKSTLFDLSAVNSIVIADIYFRLNWLETETKMDMTYRNQQGFILSAKRTDKMIHEWIKKLETFYKKMGLELKITEPQDSIYFPE